MEAAREADFDEHRWDVRAFGCAGHDGRRGITTKGPNFAWCSAQD